MESNYSDGLPLSLLAPLPFFTLNRPHLPLSNYNQPIMLMSLALMAIEHNSISSSSCAQTNMMGLRPRTLKIHKNWVILESF